VEVKAVDTVHPINKAQLLSYETSRYSAGINRQLQRAEADRRRIEVNSPGSQFRVSQPSRQRQQRSSPPLSLRPPVQNAL
jgi:hypothetical protein